MSFTEAAIKESFEKENSNNREKRRGKEQDRKEREEDEKMKLTVFGCHGKNSLLRTKLVDFKGPVW